MKVQDKKYTLQAYYSDFVFMFTLTDSRKIPIKKSTIKTDYTSVAFFLLALIFFSYYFSNWKLHGHFYALANNLPS